MKLSYKMGFIAIIIYNLVGLKKHLLTKPKAKTLKIFC